MQYSYEPYSVSKIEYKFKNMEFWSIKQTNQFTTDTTDMIKLSLILPLSL